MTKKNEGPTSAYLSLERDFEPYECEQPEMEEYAVFESTEIASKTAITRSKGHLEISNVWKGFRALFSELHSLVLTKRLGGHHGYQ